MLSFLTSPTASTIMAVYIVLAIFSAAVQNLPSPSSYGGVWYKAVYGFLSVLASDFKSFAASLPPTSEASGVKSPTETTSISTTSSSTGRE